MLTELDIYLIFKLASLLFLWCNTVHWGLSTRTQPVASMRPCLGLGRIGRRVRRQHARCSLEIYISGNDVAGRSPHWCPQVFEKRDPRHEAGSSTAAIDGGK
jgi:hypothetical protein